MQLRRFAEPVAGAIAVGSSAAVVVLYIVALQLLASGPSVSGYGVLAVANHGAVAAAVVIASVGVLLTTLRGTRVCVAVLLAGFVATWAIAAGLEALGTTLAEVQPTRQPEALSSLFYAMTGTSAAVTPVPCILLAGAVIAFVVTRASKARQSIPALAS